MGDFFQFGFMRNALAGSLVVATACSVIGVFVVLRGLAFAGAGLAHAAFGGVALGFLLGIDPLVTAVVFCIGTALLIQFAGREAGLKSDTAIGIFFAFTMALGVLFVGLMRRYDARLFGYLFGNVLGVTGTNLALMSVLTVAVLVVTGIWFKEFKFLCFDEEMAQASGQPTAFLSGMLLVLLAATVVVSIKAVGIILVEALLIIPAATAYQLTNRFGMMFVLSWLAAVVSCMAGLVASYYLAVPSGAAIVIVATALFGLAVLFSPKRRKCKVCGRQ
uniref:Metal ABC transporter permease n=1 Tax=candidate division WOR-3 bacterium TaxID=2052148 RepID=A0A7C4GE87_UNCW3